MPVVAPPVLIAPVPAVTAHAQSHWYAVPWVVGTAITTEAGIGEATAETVEDEWAIE